jgi:hypothetical protein
VGPRFASLLCHVDPSSAKLNLAFCFDGKPREHDDLVRWYGILVRTPPVHDYGPFQPVRLPNPAPMPWQSCETLGIPSIVQTMMFRSHVSFCLVEQTVWDCQNTNLLEKLMTARYWHITGKIEGDKAECWERSQVMTVTGIELLGIVEAEDVIKDCDECNITLPRYSSS